MPDVHNAVNALTATVANWASRVFSLGWQALVPFFPVLGVISGLLLIILAVGLVLRLHRERTFHGATLQTIDAMEGEEFEGYLATLFAHLGYRVQHVGMSHDFGADLLLTSRRGKRIVVQAKRYAGRVGISAVQEVLGAVRYWGAARGLVVTNSSFTESARELAARSGVELWDRDRLVSAMARVGRGGRPSARAKSAYNNREE